MNNPHILAQFSTHLAFESFFGRAVNLPSDLMVAQRAGPDTLSGRKDCRICSHQGDKLRRKTRFFAANALIRCVDNTQRSIIHASHALLRTHKEISYHVSP